MNRKNLIVVRAGISSLHARWLEIPYAERNYDLLVSYFSEEAYGRFAPSEGVTAVFVKGGKWDGLFKTLGAVNLERYHYFWLPDDDIDVSACDVNRMFQLCERHGLAVAQPALSRDSYFSHFIFNRCSAFRLRYTNYVEIMVPCLSREVLRRSLPFFEGTMSGFGLDYIWCRWTASGAFRVAILDAVEAHHTRPVGSALKPIMMSSGAMSACDEESRLKQQVGIKYRTVPLSYAGILVDGQPVAGRLPMALRMCSGWLRDLSAFRDPVEARAGIIKVFRRQLFKTLDLRFLEESAR